MRFCGASQQQRAFALVAASSFLEATLAPPAYAAAPASSANSVGDEGLKAYEAGRYVEADEKLSRALDAVGAPTLALYAARTNVRLNHWIKASELYSLAMRPNPKSPSSLNLLQVQHDAERERAALLSRMPRLTIVLEGEDLASVTVILDGAIVPKALLGAHQLLDPGRHEVVATRDGQSVTGKLELVEHQHKITRLHFAQRQRKDSDVELLPSIATIVEHEAPRNASTTPSQPHQFEPATGGSPTVEERLFGPDRPSFYQRDRADSSTDSPNQLRTWGWVSLALGGAGLMVGTAAGVMAISAHNELKDSQSCAGNSCFTSASSTIDRYNRARTWSTIGFVSAGLFGATGGVLLIIGSGHERNTQASLVLGPASAALSGRF